MRFAVLAAVVAAFALAATMPATAQNYGGHGPIPLTWTTDVTVPDSDTLCVGTGSDYCCSHDGTDTVCTSGTGDLVIDNTDANDPTILRLGTDTSATSVIVENNGGEDLLTVRGDGAILVGPDALPLDLIDCSMTAAAESADTIAVTIACTDAMGDAVSSAMQLEVALFESTAMSAWATEDVISETGAGTMWFDLVGGAVDGDEYWAYVVTSAAGAATITVTDTGGGSSATRLLRVRDGGSPDVHVLTRTLSVVFDATDSSP